MVERGIFDGPVLDAYLQDLLLPFRYCNIDYIVLGCTHYPFVRALSPAISGQPCLHHRRRVRASPGAFCRQLEVVFSDRPNRVWHGHLQNSRLRTSWP